MLSVIENICTLCGGRRSPPATPRHPLPPLRLLPSGPDRVHGFALRGDRRGPP